MSQASAAREYQDAIGHDIDLSFELADYEAEQEADAEKWERYGRAEMYATLELGGY